MSSGLCKNCKHYRPRDGYVKQGDEFVKRENVGYCASGKFVTGWVYGMRNETPIDGVAHLDNLNHWVSTFEVGAHFGCIHWEDKNVQ